VARKRVLRVLFVRPDLGGRLSPLFAFGPPIDSGDVLPVALLRLATAVKLGSPHRVFVHDARRDKAGNRSTRAVATVHKADVCVVELDLALLRAGLEVARAARDGGCRLVLASGPLAETWPAAVAGMPEFDGVIDPGGAPSLLALLGRAATDSLDAASLAEALGAAPGPPPAEARGTDRRLLDYAAYRRPHRLLGANPWRRVDKGRSAASPVLCEDEAGEPLPLDHLRADIEECALLGIPRLALRTARRLPLAELESLVGGARFVVPAAAEGPDAAASLARLGVEAVDLGDVGMGDATAVAEVVSWSEATRAHGLGLVGRACFGTDRVDAEEDALRELETAQVSLDAVHRVAIPPNSTAAQRAWSAWLDAPRVGFVPATLHGDRGIELAERARVLLTGPPRRGTRELAGRLLRWAVQPRG